MENDWNRPGGACRRQRRLGSNHKNELDALANQFLGQPRKALGFQFGEASLNDEVLGFGPALFLEFDHDRPLGHGDLGIGPKIEEPDLSQCV